MVKYSYTAKTDTGEDKTGVAEAEDKHGLAAVLRKNGLVLISAKLMGNDTAKHRSGKIDEWMEKANNIVFGRVSLVDKMMFTRHLAVMIESGLSLNQALRALAEQNKNPVFCKVIRSVDTSVTSGNSLSDALAAHPKVFNGLYTSMTRVGETGGNLTEVLRILAEQMKKDHELISRVRGAMMYPAVIVVAMLGIGVLMMIKVVPQLTGVFAELKVDLPLSTRVVIGISNFMKDNYIISLAIIISIGIGFKFALQIKAVRKMTNQAGLYAPVFGSLVRKINSARFARTLGSLINSGVPIVKSLEIVAGTLGNIQFGVALNDCAMRVQKGQSLGDSLQEHKDLFTPMVVQMVKVGEETGNLADILKNLAEFYEEEIDNITKNMSAIIEPIIMVVIGAVVGFFAVSMLQPMYSMMGGM